MRLPYFDYVEPANMNDVFMIIKQFGGKAQPFAGGTDLLVLMRFGLLQPDKLISLRNLPELKGIELQGQYLQIGAMTTLSELVASPAIKKNMPALHEAALAVAAPPIRNVATIGGNVFQNSRCLFYNQSQTWRLERQPCLKAGGSVCLAVPGGKKCFSVYQGDIAPVLIAACARVRLEKKDEKPREVALEELFTNEGREPVRVQPGEIATRFILSVPQNTGSSYQKFRLRSAVDYPLAGAAAFVSVKRGTIDGARLVLSAAGPAPLSLPLDGLVVGKKPEAIDLNAIGRSVPRNLPLVDNQILPAAYRRAMFSVFAKRAMKAALERIKEG